MKSKKLRLFLSSTLIFFLFPGIALGCASFEPNSSLYISLFRSDLSELSGRDGAYYYPDAQLSPWATDSETENVRDWQSRALLPSPMLIPQKDLIELVYNTSEETLNAIKKAIQMGKKPPLGDNLLVRFLVNKGDSAILDYLLFVRAVNSSKDSDDAWEYRPLIPEQTEEMAQRADKRANEATTPFLKERYRYQQLRLRFSLGENEEVIRLFERYFASDNSDTTVAVWARSLYAGAFYRTREYARAYVEFARVFHASERYRSGALLGARWATEANPTVVAEALALAHNPEIKKEVRFLTAYLQYKPAPQEIAILAELYPTEPELEVLAIREINKLEEQLRPLEELDWKYFVSYRAEKEKEALTVLNSLESSAERLTGSSKNVALWKTINAYLAYLRRDYTTARKRVADAMLLEKTAKVTEQLAILALAIDVRTAKLDAIGEAHLLWGLRPLSRKSGDVDDQKYASVYLDRVFAHLVGHLLADRYSQEGRIDKAVAAASLPNRTTSFLKSYAEKDAEVGSAFDMMEKATPDQIARVREYVLSPKTEFDRFLTAGFPYSREKLLEIESVRRMGLHDYAGAVRSLEQLRRAGWSIEGYSQSGDLSAFSDPVPYKGGSIIPFESEGKTALTFAKRMEKLQETALARGGTWSARDTYAYAVGLYQTGARGNAWNFSSYSASPSVYTWAVDSRPDTDFYRGRTAEKFLARVAEQADDRELRARALFMASLVLQQNRVLFDYNGKRGDYFTENPYFSELKKSYADTEFYKEAVQRCSYLEDFK